jgi:LPS sulfotransferase NodH
MPLAAPPPSAPLPPAAAGRRLWPGGARDTLQGALAAWGLRQPAPLPYEAQFGAEMDQPRFDGQPRTWLMATTPRCGSHFLGHALWQTGCFGVPLEYLNRRNLPRWHARFRAPTVTGVFRALRRCRTSPTGWFGIKSHWSQYAPFADHRLFDVLGGVQRIVHVVRRDRLAQAISLTLAQQTGQWISGAPQTGAAVFDHAAIARNAAAIAAQNRAWRACLAAWPGSPVLRLAYEDMAADPAGSFGRVAAFLDPDIPVQPRAAARTERQATGLAQDWAARFRAGVRDGEAWILQAETV